MTSNIFRVRSAVGLNALLVQMQHRLTWRGESCAFKSWNGIPTLLSLELAPGFQHAATAEDNGSLPRRSKALERTQDTEARQTQWQGRLLSHRRGPHLFHCTHGDKWCCLHRVRESWHSPAMFPYRLIFPTRPNTNFKATFQE